MRGDQVCFLLWGHSEGKEVGGAIAFRWGRCARPLATELPELHCSGPYLPGPHGQLGHDCGFPVFLMLENQVRPMIAWPCGFPRLSSSLPSPPAILSVLFALLRLSSLLCRRRAGAPCLPLPSAWDSPLPDTHEPQPLSSSQGGHFPTH